MSDRLEALMAHFSINARTFHAGALCGVNSPDHRHGLGQLHLLSEGELVVRHGAQTVATLREPTMLLYPRPMDRLFVTDEVLGANVVCANLEFQGGAANPIASALPPYVFLPLSDLHDVRAVLDLLFQEASSGNCGRKVVLDRLFDVVLVQVLRVLMEKRELQSGMLAGLAHPLLRKAIVAMHESPGEGWSLGSLADIANMSRTAFAVNFKGTVGCTPGAYLQAWRIGMAKRALLAGRAMKHVAMDVGYGSEAALSRAFKAQTGSAPREWLKARLGGEANPT